MPEKGVPAKDAASGKPKIQPAGKYSMDLGKAETAVSLPKKHSKNKV